MKVIFFISLDATVFAFCASGLTRIGPIYRLTANKPIATKIPNQKIGLQKVGEKIFSNFRNLKETDQVNFLKDFWGCPRDIKKKLANSWPKLTGEFLASHADVLRGSSRVKWGRNAWRTPKNVCVVGWCVPCNDPGNNPSRDAFRLQFPSVSKVANIKPITRSNQP